MDQLVAERRYRFGEFILDPTDQRLTGPAGPIRIGHKAIVVLHELIAHAGRLVTKEQLFGSAWQGVIVSEAALTSVIKELRRALGDNIHEPRFIQSVYGQGYRFIAPVTVAPDAQAIPLDRLSSPAPVSALQQAAAPTGKMSRRQLTIGGAGGLAALAISGWMLRNSLVQAVPEEVIALAEHAQQILQQNTYEGQNQAIGMLRRVVAMAPDYADGWGMLGITYGVVSHYRDRGESLILQARANAAAKRALDLDPRNAKAEAALSVALPFIGHWFERDGHLDRAVERNPADDDILTYKAVTLIFEGRNREAVSIYRRLHLRPMTPAIYSNYIRALWSAGEIEETDRALDDAGSLYPTQPNVWFDRLNIWMLSGRMSAAIQLAENASERPSQVSDDEARGLVEQARFIQNPLGTDGVRQRDKLMENVRKRTADAQFTVRLLSAANYLDDAFAVISAYYFNEGPMARGSSAEDTFDQRQTRFLFEPATASLREDRRFEALVSRLGLDGYWRQSGHPPDYRQPEPA